MSLLHLTNVHAFYGKSHILHGVDMQVGEGEIVSLLGRNGSGRSTTAKAVMGLVDGRGSVKFRDKEVLGCKAFEIAHQGIGYVPENRDIFPKLTVHQAHDRLDRRRAARSVSAEQADDLALADVHVDAVQDMALAIVGLEVLELEQHAQAPFAAGWAAPATWASASTEPR